MDTQEPSEQPKTTPIGVGCIALVGAYSDYVKLLGAELDELIPFAAGHGWKSTRYEEGCRLRKLIADLSAPTVSRQESPGDTGSTKENK